MGDSRLVLIDGMAVVFRSFYAIRGMSRPDGTPTNALFGFIRTLAQVRRELQPTHLLVAFDGGVPPHRLELIPAYKAQRPPTPDDLRVQVPMIREYLECAGIMQCRLDGWEADDIIATASVRARDTVTDQIIVTGDKDLFQLVTDRVTISRNGSSKELLTPDGVRAKTGVLPPQIPAWLALVGDSADNIPGIPGIGPRTAARLLAEHGTLDRIWAFAAGDHTGRIARLLREHRARVEQNLEAVILRADVEAVPAVTETVLREPAHGPLAAFFKEMAFYEWERQLREPQLDLEMDDNSG